MSGVADDAVMLAASRWLDEAVSSISPVAESAVMLAESERETLTATSGVADDAVMLAANCLLLTA